MNFVMVNDEVVLVKSVCGLLCVCVEVSYCLIRVVVICYFVWVINFEQYCWDFVSVGVFKWIVDLEEEIWYYWLKDNMLLYKECLMFF